MSNSVLLPFTQLLVSIISVQLGASFAKQVFPILGACGTVALRVGLAAILLALFVRPWRVHLSRLQWIPILGYGLVLGIMNLLFYLSLERIPLGIAVALEFMGPLAVSFIFSRSRRDFLWGLLAFAGVILVLPLTAGSKDLSWTGIFLALGAGCAWGLYIVLGKKAGEVIEGKIAASFGMLVAALVVVPIGIYHTRGNLFQLDLFPTAIAIAILSSALPYTLEMAALKRLDAAQFGILMSLEPAIAALSGALILGEMLSKTQCLAIVLIMMASMGVALDQRRKTQRNYALNQQAKKKRFE